MRDPHNDDATPEGDDHLEPLTPVLNEAERRAEAIRYHMTALEDLAEPASRHDGWTPFARRLFLEMLAETGRITAACDACGLSKQSAEALRARDSLFAAGWDAACELARMLLADALYERAIEGVTETIERDGQVIATKHRHDSRLSIAVLGRLDKRCDRAAETGARHLGAVARWDDFTRAIGQDDETTVTEILQPFVPSEVEGREISPHSQPSQLHDEEVPIPSEDHGRIWWDDIEEEWRTDYPPPPGFGGYQSGDYNMSGYSRTLAPEESALIEAEEAAIAAEEAAEDATRRDRHFAELADLLAHVSTETRHCESGARSNPGETLDRHAEPVLGVDEVQIRGLAMTDDRGIE
jgi:hypothetical protein